jgi:ubiquinone/menaquinone biosynthesis C-methylase UbiE
MFADLLARVLRAVLHRAPGLYNLKLVRGLFWTVSAREVDHLWGHSHACYDLMAKTIVSVAPRRLLDVGCGSGRLFALYRMLGIQEIVGQDIAPTAIKIAAQRYPEANITLTTAPITELSYPPGYFDLVMSVRVLQHIPAHCIAEVVRKICTIGKAAYVNELSDSECHGSSPYVFQHDYEGLFAEHGFGVKERGSISQQSWLLFSK